MSEMYIRMAGVFCGAITTLVSYFIIGKTTEIYIVIYFLFELRNIFSKNSKTLKLLISENFF